jgi:hypothetical protein
MDLLAPASIARSRHGDKVIEFHTRFLFPFYYERGTATRAAGTLIADDGLAAGSIFWRREKPRQLYTDEFLLHVVRYLFPDQKRSEGSPEVECEYLIGNEKILENWFKGAEVRLPSGLTIPILPKSFVEVFLTSQSVGLLSITLAASDSLTSGAVAEFNYRLSQFRRKPVVGLVKPHPEENGEKYKLLSPEAQAAISARPSPEASLEVQLASPYGRFTLEQLVVRLILKPLQELKVEPVEPRELAVYTVVRLPEVDFADQSIRTEYAPVLSRLAQIEEHDHPSSDPENLSIPAAVFNRRHWAAVGVLGAAHLAADETNPDGSEKAFNSQRMRIIRDKYFISFLVTMLQRMTLNRAVAEATEIFTVPIGERAVRTARLRGDLLRFSVGGQFNQINSRHAHHRYYQVCRVGLDVIPAWQDIREVLAELDADHIAQEQVEQQKKLTTMASGLTSNVTEIERLQHVVHMIEYLLGVVYGAHLLHMMLVHNQKVEHWFSMIGVDSDGYGTCIPLMGAFIGFLFVFAANKYFERKEEKHTS